MFQFIPVNENNIISIRASGELTHKDYQAFLPQLECMIKTDEKNSLLIELDDFHGMEFKAIKDDFKFAMDNGDAFEKVAVVGDKKWLQWMTLFASPFVKGKIKYFDYSALQDAWNWLREVELSKDELANQAIMPYKKIMAAVDFSSYSKHSARRAIEIAKQYHSELQLVYIVDEAAFYDLYGIGSGMDISMVGFAVEAMNEASDLIDAMIEKAEVRMANLLDDLGLDSFQGIVLAGRSTATLISFAEAQDVDLIVMGTRGRRGAGSVINASSTQYVQSHARCEVLSVPLVN